VAGLVAGAGVAQAQLTSADVGVNPTFVQSGPSTVAPAGGFFSARAFFTNPNDFEAGPVLRRPRVAGGPHAWLLPALAHLGRFKFVPQCPTERLSFRPLLAGGIGPL
jgi:hypothetical protein